MIAAYYSLNLNKKTIDLYRLSIYNKCIDNLYNLRITKGEIMAIDKGLLSGSTTTLILKLLEEKDMYGYEMIATLLQKSDNVFDLKAGTLYPLLHNLEKSGALESYEEKSGSDKTRKYYHLTSKGQGLLNEKQKEWIDCSQAINKILSGGKKYAIS